MSTSFVTRRSRQSRPLKLAEQAWEQNNADRVRQLLEETASYSERGFEWYYWQRQIHQEIETLRGHTEGVTH